VWVGFGNKGVTCKHSACGCLAAFSSCQSNLHRTGEPQMATMPQLLVVLLPTARHRQINRVGVIASQGQIQALKQVSAQPRVHSQSIRACVWKLQKGQGIASGSNLPLQSNCMCPVRALSFLVMQGHCIPEAAAGAASGFSMLFLDSFCLTGFDR